ncbi:hypothetical protein ACFWZ7_05140 [Nocardiopsis alba]|uniref:hypothetical protein n=1 Tax=Nocardiopsis alba TaxID=53437 RepID=UPI003670E9F2
MSDQPRWRVGPLRRATRNLLLALDVADRPLLVKFTRDPAEARAEVRGHNSLSPYYRVPALYGRLRIPAGAVLLYERLPIRADHGLFLDLLNSPGPDMKYLDSYLQQLITTYRQVIEQTLQLTAPEQLVRKLYWDRAASGGRLDTYYQGVDFEAFPGVPASTLNAYTLVINGRQHHLDWSACLARSKEYFTSGAPEWTALTQGDPTDVNLACAPVAWLDYDTAGMNSILGEFANFLWYTTAMGGWLVPRYNPGAFTDHPATFERCTENTPTWRSARVDSRHKLVHLRYDPAPAPTRRHAATVYWEQLALPLIQDLWPETDPGRLLRPYLVLRLLGVYNVARLRPEDRQILLAHLAELMSPDFSPSRFFRLETA